MAAPLDESTSDPLLLPEGARLLHIGPHKTGTTAVQQAFDRARPELKRFGVHYAGRTTQTYDAAVDLLGNPGRLGVPRRRGAWDELVDEVRAAADQRVVISSETFSGAKDDTIARLRDDLGDRLHVVRAVRRLDKLLPSQWQQTVVNGSRTPYVRWLRDVLSGEGHRFWRRQSYRALTERWARVVGPENVTVIVVDDNDHRHILDVFERLTGLPSETLELSPTVDNRSLTANEAAVARNFNVALKRNRWSARTQFRLMRLGALRGFKGRPTDPDDVRLAIPTEFAAAVAEVSNREVDALASLGVRVVGDLESLRLDAGAMRTVPAATFTESGLTLAPEAVADAVVALVERALATGKEPLVAKVGDPEQTHLASIRGSDLPPALVSTWDLNREVARRGLSRVGGKEDDR